MNKTILVTGASRGIGAATALYFGKAGWNTVINYNSSKKEAEQIVTQIRSYNGVAEAFKADLTSPEECKKLVDFTTEKFGRIDALVNNAAMSVVGLFDMISDADEKRLFELNLFAPMRLSKLVLPLMLHEKSGAIVNVSSMWGQVGASCEVQYSTAKAALIGFTKALAKELAPSGIRVNCVAPGVIDTDMNSHLSEAELTELADEIPMGRIGSPDEVAECIYFLVNSASYMTGQVISPNGGYTT